MRPSFQHALLTRGFDALLGIFPKGGSLSPCARVSLTLVENAAHTITICELERIQLLMGGDLDIHGKPRADGYLMLSVDENLHTPSEQSSLGPWVNILRWIARTWQLTILCGARS